MSVNSAGDSQDRSLLRALAADPALRLAFVAFAANGALYGSVLSRYAEIADAVGASAQTFGAALAAGAVGGLVGAALSPVVMRRAGPAAAVVVAGCAYAVLAAGVGLAPTVMALGALLLVMGAVDGAHDVSMNALTVTVQQRRKTSLMGRAHATWSLALTAGTALGAGAAALGVPVAVHIGAVAAVVAAAQLHSALTARRPSAAAIPAAPQRSAQQEPDAPSPQGRQRGPAPSGQGLTRGVKVSVAALILAAVAASYVEGPGQDWTAVLLGRGFQAAPGLAAAGPLVFSIGLLAARLVLDAISARVSKTAISIVAATLIASSMSAGFLLAITGGPVWLALAAITLAGLGAGPIYPMLFNAAETLSTRHHVPPSSTAAVISSCSRVGAITAPAAVGLLAGSTSLFAIFAVMALGGLALLISLPRALR